MTTLRSFINGDTEITFGDCTVDAYFDLEHALDDWCWDGIDLVEIMNRLNTIDDFSHFLWIAKNLVAHRIADLSGNINHVCNEFTK